MIVLNTDILTHLSERFEQKDPEAIELKEKEELLLEGIKNKANELDLDIEEISLMGHAKAFRYRAFRFDAKNPKDPFRGVGGKMTFEPFISERDGKQRYNHIVTVRGRHCSMVDLFNPLTRGFESFLAVKKNVVRSYEVDDVNTFIDSLNGVFYDEGVRYIEHIDYGDEAYLYLSKRFTEALFSLNQKLDGNRNHFEQFIRRFDSTTLSAFREVVLENFDQRYDIVIDLIEQDQKQMIVIYLTDNHLDDAIAQTQIDFDNFFLSKQANDYSQSRLIEKGLEKLFRQLGDLRDPEVLTKTMQIIEKELKRKLESNPVVIGDPACTITVSESQGKMKLTYESKDILNNAMNQEVDIDYEGSVVSLYRRAVDMNGNILFHLRPHRFATAAMRYRSEYLPRFRLVCDTHPQVDILEYGSDREERIGEITYRQGLGFHLALYVGVGDQEHHVYTPDHYEIFNFLKALSERKTEYIGFTAFKDIGRDIYRGMIYDRYHYRVEQAFFDKVLIIEKTEEGLTHRWISFEEFKESVSGMKKGIV